MNCGHRRAVVACSGRRVPVQPKVRNRHALCSILFVLHTGIQWEHLPQDLGVGSGIACRRQHAIWNEAGCPGWPARGLLRAAKQLDWSRTVIESPLHVQAARRGPRAAPARSTAHGRAASTPSSSTGRTHRSRSPLVSGNAIDFTHLLPLLGKIPSVPELEGRPADGLGFGSVPAAMTGADRSVCRQSYRRAGRDRQHWRCVIERDAPKLHLPRTRSLCRAPLVEAGGRTR